MPLHGGKLAAKALKEAGVEVVFTLSGGHIMPLYDGCIDEGIKIVDVRHEQAAVHAADSWAQMMRPQGAIYGWDRLEGVLLNRTRYDKVVEALGGHGEYVTEPDHLRPALKRSAASGLPALINVEIRQDREYGGAIYV